MDVGERRFDAASEGSDAVSRLCRKDDDNDGGGVADDDGTHGGYCFSECSKNTLHDLCRCVCKSVFSTIT